MLNDIQIKYINELANNAKFNVNVLEIIDLDLAYEDGKKIVKELTDTNEEYEADIKILADVLNI